LPIFRVQVNYTLNTVNKWSNVWHVQATTLGNVSAACVTQMEEKLLALLSNACVLKSFLISAVDSDAFFTNDRNNPGTNEDTGSLLPLWNCVRVVFPPTDSGRPDVKYFKGLVGENTQSGGILESAVQALVDTEVELMIDDMADNGTPLCGDTGQVYTSAQVQEAVQMRQMHRKRKKKVVAP
jgi:hypothetical protein